MSLPIFVGRVRVRAADRRHTVSAIDTSRPDVPEHPGFGFLVNAGIGVNGVTLAATATPEPSRS